jgi:hypothetical protein
VTLEILAVVVTPLLVLYLRGEWLLRRTVPCMVSIPVLWYFTYAPLHELSHVAGTYLAGGRVTYIRLIPPFWAGQFGHAWITPVGLKTDLQWLVMTSAPYVLDVVCVVAGYILLRKRFFRRPFVLGFTFMLLGLRPAFDLVCETVALGMGVRGDLNHIEKTIGGFAVRSLLILSIAISGFEIAEVLRRYGKVSGDAQAVNV